MSLFNRYAREVDRVVRVGRDEETELAQRYKAGDKKAGQQLVANNLKFVWKIAHKYDTMGFNFGDLVQEGNIGLLTAAKKFDPSRGHKFITYAVWWIDALIKEYTIRNWSAVRIGTSTAQRKLFFSLRRERKLLEEKLGVEPTNEQIAESMRVRVREVEEMNQRIIRDTSLNARVRQEDRKSEIGDLLEYETISPEERAIRLETINKVRSTLAQLSLNDRQKAIVEHRFMTDEPKTLEELGQEFGGVSRERVRQLEMKLRETLREAFSEPN